MFGRRLELAAARQARGRLGGLRRIGAGVWEAAGAGRCAAGAGWVAALLLHGFAAARRSSPGERERARRPSRALIEPGGVYAGFAAISSEGSLPPGEEIASYRERMAGRAACRPISESAKFAQVTSSLGRNVVAGELAPPPHAFTPVPATSSPPERGPAGRGRKSRPGRVCPSGGR